GAPPRLDEQELKVWQKEAAPRLSVDEARRWLGSVLPAALDETAAHAFIAAVLPNVVLPEDARPWVEIVFGEPPALQPAEEQLVRAAGPRYFSAAANAAAAKIGRASCRERRRDISGGAAV